jgi:hypothetical protein
LYALHREPIQYHRLATDDAVLFVGVPLQYSLSSYLLLLLLFVASNTIDIPISLADGYPEVGNRRPGNTLLIRGRLSPAHYQSINNHIAPHHGRPAQQCTMPPPVWLVSLWK